jgi:uncharacterized protein (TIGR02444 family)
LAIYNTASFPPNQLWDFATKIYSSPEVEEACLSLQDRRGLDVNLIIFCIWVAASGRGTLTEEEMTTGIDAGIVWQSQVVGPLRHVRRFLKGPIAPADGRLGAELARVVSESELYSEHMEIQILSDILVRPATGSFDMQERGQEAASNLQAYLDRMIEDINNEDRSALLVIWQESFPAANPKYTDLFFPLMAA